MNATSRTARIGWIIGIAGACLGLAIGTWVVCGGKTVEHRLVGNGVELHRGSNWLHVQVDVSAEGFLQSVLRTAGATVELQVVSGRTDGP